MEFSSYHGVYVIPTPKEVSLPGPEVRVDAYWGVQDRSGEAGLAKRYAEEFGVADTKRTMNFSLVRRDDLRAEEYRLDIAKGEVTVSASSERGFLHALATLRQLRNGAVLPTGSIRISNKTPAGSSMR